MAAARRSRPSARPRRPRRDDAAAACDDGAAALASFAWFLEQLDRIFLISQRAEIDRLTDRAERLGGHETREGSKALAGLDEWTKRRKPFRDGGNDDLRTAFDALDIEGRAVVIRLLERAAAERARSLQHQGPDAQARRDSLQRASAGAERAARRAAATVRAEVDRVAVAFDEVFRLAQVSQDDERPEFAESGRWRQSWRAITSSARGLEDALQKVTAPRRRAKSGKPPAPALRAAQAGIVDHLAHRLERPRAIELAAVLLWFSAVQWWPAPWKTDSLRVRVRDLERGA